MNNQVLQELFIKFNPLNNVCLTRDSYLINYVIFQYLHVERFIKKWEQILLMNSNLWFNCTGEFLFW
jgi:hypothetical protein